MSIYSEYLDRITNGDLDTRHGGSLATSFEKVAKSVRDFESKLSAFESNINPLYDVYNGGDISGDTRNLKTLFTRPHQNPFVDGVSCRVKTSIDGVTVSQNLDVTSYLQYSYGYVNDDPGYHSIAGDKYTWFIELTNNGSRDWDTYINLYHPNGELFDESMNYLTAGEQNHRVYSISIHSYQSIPKVLFHFYRGSGSNAPVRIDIRPSDDVIYERWDSFPI